MRAFADDPRLLRWLVGLLVGIPVALVLAAAFPDRQGSQFVPFLLTGLVAFGVVWLLALGVERWFTRRYEAAERRTRR